MLKLLGFIIKISVFSLVVIALSHLVQLRGRTVSDQVKIQMAQAEKAEITRSVKKFATESVPSAVTQMVKDSKQGAARVSNLVKDQVVGERLDLTEREKVKNLIRELNSSDSNKHAKQ